MIQHISEAEFTSKVLESDLPVLVDFFADWCGPCKMMSPVLEELSEEYAGKALIVKVNVDDNRDLSRTYKVMSIPNMILFKGGQKVDQIIGAVPKEEVKAKLEAAL